MRLSHLTHMTSFKLPASFKSKIAMRKKPVMKWKAYKRPGKCSDLGEIPDEMADGCYEEECAFMWRTIEDDSESDKISPVSKRNSKDSRHMFSDNDHISTEHRVFSSYTETKSRTLDRTKCAPTDFVQSSPKLQISPYRRFCSKRSRYKPIPGGWSEAATNHLSLPQLYCASCGQPPRYPDVVRSISENSLFVEAVAQRVESRFNSTNSLNFPRTTVLDVNRRDRRKYTHQS